MKVGRALKKAAYQTLWSYSRSLWPQGASGMSFHLGKTNSGFQCLLLLLAMLYDRLYLYLCSTKQGCQSAASEEGVRSRCLVAPTAKWWVFLGLKLPIGSKAIKIHYSCPVAHMNPIPGNSTSLFKPAVVLYHTDPRDTREFQMRCRAGLSPCNPSFQVPSRK